MSHHETVAEARARVRSAAEQLDALADAICKDESMATQIAAELSRIIALLDEAEPTQ